MHTKIQAVLLATVLGSAPALAANAPQPKVCSTAEHRQFDFWVGKWEVYLKTDPKKKIVAHSLIENLYDGCAIRENWMPLTQTGGGSLNTYVAATKQWHQFWIDNQGSADFFGGLKGNAMVIEGLWPQPGHPKQRTRITYTPLATGEVEQLGVTSDDAGKTWQPSFDFIYRKGK